MNNKDFICWLLSCFQGISVDGFGITMLTGKMIRNVADRVPLCGKLFARVQDKNSGH